MSKRLPMTPAEFAEACRKFELHYAGRIHQTSGTRSIEGNKEAGGHADSKHLLGMARDYRFPEATPGDDFSGAVAKSLGLWWKPYPWGCHVQGLPPGAVAKWWMEKYGPKEGV